MMVNAWGQAIACGERLRRGPGVPLDLDSAESRVDKVDKIERRAPSAERRAPSAPRVSPALCVA